jgi:hypothetical protein
MMFLARILSGGKPEVYPLDGALITAPRAWAFCSYRRGACAIHYTEVLAVRTARRKLYEQPVQRATA